MFALFSLPIFLLLLDPDLLGLRFNRFGATGLELLNASCDVHELLFSGIERMALGADLNADLFFGGPGNKRIAARTNDAGFREIGRM